MTSFISIRKNAQAVLLRAGLKIQEGSCFRSQTGRAAKTLRAAGLLTVAGVGSALTAHKGMRGPRRLGHPQNPQPQDPLQFQTGSWNSPAGRKTGIDHPSSLGGCAHWFRTFPPGEKTAFYPTRLAIVNNLGTKVNMLSS